MIAVVPRYPRGRRPRSAGPPIALRPAASRGSGCGRPAATAFTIFDLQNAEGTPIYVHAKVCVVDDEWMTIGSDNLNLRSWTHDSELTCAVVDPDGELPRALRTSLWAEHLGLPDDDPRLAGLDDPVDLWTSRVRRSRQPDPGARAAPAPSSYDAVGPAGLPLRLRPRRPAAAAARDHGLLRTRSRLGTDTREVSPAGRPAAPRAPRPGRRAASSPSGARARRGSARSTPDPRPRSARRRAPR